MRACRRTPTHSSPCHICHMPYLSKPNVERPRCRMSGTNWLTLLCASTKYQALQYAISGIADVHLHNAVQNMTTSTLSCLLSFYVSIEAFDNISFVLHSISLCYKLSFPSQNTDSFRVAGTTEETCNLQVFHWSWGNARSVPNNYLTPPLPLGFFKKELTLTHFWPDFSAFRSSCCFPKKTYLSSSRIASFTHETFCPPDEEAATSSPGCCTEAAFLRFLRGFTCPDGFASFVFARPFFNLRPLFLCTSGFAGIRPSIMPMCKKPV